MAENDFFSNVALVPLQDLEILKRDLAEVKKMLSSKKEEEKNDEWLESREARKALKMSYTTWFKTREKRLIPFSRVGNKIYVKRADIQAFLEGHRVSENPNEEPTKTQSDEN